MPIPVECPCGKQFHVKDELAGRRMRCTGCGQVLTIGPAPVKAAQAKPAAGATPRLAISPKLIALGVAILLVPLTILLIKLGPVRARDQWRDMGPRAEAEIQDVLNAALRKVYAEEAATLEKFTPPQVTNLNMDEPILMWKAPERVSFQGRTTATMVTGFSKGSPQLTNFRGQWRRDGQVEAELELEDQAVQVRGRVVEGKVELEKP